MIKSDALPRNHSSDIRRLFSALDTCKNKRTENSALIDNSNSLHSPRGIPDLFLHRYSIMMSHVLFAAF